MLSIHHAAMHSMHTPKRKGRQADIFVVVGWTEPDIVKMIIPCAADDHTCSNVTILFIYFAKLHLNVSCYTTFECANKFHVLSE